MEDARHANAIQVPQPAPSRLIAHPDRGLILGEVHARPFAPMDADVPITAQALKTNN